MPQRLPSVDTLARTVDAQGLPRTLIVDVARSAIDEARIDPDGPDAATRAAADIAHLVAIRDRVVVNGTGVLLHTNLGRAPLAPVAADAAAEAATHYTNLEFDLAEGARGGRAGYVRRLAASLVGAEDALVVNNNAGALLLALAALSSGRSTAVSRGELIEIGGSYRLPELMAASGAHMLEVGTTNRTHLADYERALEQGAKLVLRVHPSNYRVVGFTDDVSPSELADLAHRFDVPFVFDVGSGLLDANVPWLDGPPPRWLVGEPGVRQSLEAGADLVTFSGDKLLGGPQAGVVVGRRDLIDTIRRHPIARALRIDGPTIAAVTTTFEMYANGEALEIPFWKMATLPFETLARRAEHLVEGLDAVVVEGASVPGAGSVPGAEVPSPLVRIERPGAATLWPRLLAADPPVVARREAGKVLLDLRTVPENLDGYVAETLRTACRS